VVDETITYLTAAGNCDGAISLQVSGGFPPYNFYWYGPNGFASSSPNISGLCEGWYYLDLYDNNNCETTDQYFVEHNTCIPITVNHIAGDVAPVSKSVTYSTVTNIPGEPDKCWITSNLGADHQAVSVDDSTEASAGWYWQFNRKQGYKHDGLSLTPWWFIGGIFFEDSDWLSSNDPCNLELGALWRLPTNTEFYNVNNVGGWTSWNGPWNSGLKLHAAGMLLYDNGFLLDRGIYGVYWSSTQNSSLYGCNLLFYSTSSATNFNVKASGFSVRCLKDN
jgi:hypothetical protein